VSLHLTLLTLMHNNEEAECRMFSANTSKPFFPCPMRIQTIVSPNFFSSIVKSIVVVLYCALVLQK
jgi:hypothetical protein